MDPIETLQKLGLTEKQARVYMAMLEMGQAGMTKIAKKAGLKRPTVYLVIDELNILGLVGEIIKGKKKLYSATHPKRIVELANFRSRQAEDILPELVARQKTSGKPKVRMLEGIEGVRVAYREAFSLLNNKQEGLWMGNVSFLIRNSPEILREYNILIKKIRDPHIRDIVYGGDESKKWVEDMQGRLTKNHQIKYFGDSNNFGMTDQLVIGDTVISFSLGKEIFVLIIEGREIAQTQRWLFETIWEKL